jgi:predicted unusual protein kinase regulating ubiquinone biosynthesis (AarF/ABC1/UbiB family)
MSMVQALGKGLDPDFDFFKELMPHVENIYRRRYSLSATVRRFPGALANLAVFGADVPRRIIRIVRSVERGELHIRTDVLGLDRQLTRLESITKFLVIGLIAASIIFGITIIILATRL